MGDINNNLYILRYVDKVQETMKYYVIVDMVLIVGANTFAAILIVIVLTICYSFTFAVYFFETTLNFF